MSEGREIRVPGRGVVRLFPLPNLVVFPYVVQPLHIFEPRYRQLLADALDGDRLLAMALLRPGWEKDYHKAPPLYPVVCVGRIEDEERLADGRYNLLLHGMARARVVEELDTGMPYRSARVELLLDVDAPARVGAELRQRIGEQVGRAFAGQGAALDRFRELLESPVALGALCDVISFALPMGVGVKQQLLEESRSEERARRLLAHLEEADGPPEAPNQFPPGFSAN